MKKKNCKSKKKDEEGTEKLKNCKRLKKDEKM